MSPDYWLILGLLVVVPVLLAVLPCVLVLAESHVVGVVGSPRLHSVASAPLWVPSAPLCVRSAVDQGCQALSPLSALSPQGHEAWASPLLVPVAVFGGSGFSSVSKVSSPQSGTLSSHPPIGSGPHVCVGIGCRYLARPC